jgi:hypothetical protein
MPPPILPPIPPPMPHYPPHILVAIRLCFLFGWQAVGLPTRLAFWRSISWGRFGKPWNENVPTDRRIILGFRRKAGFDGVLKSESTFGRKLTFPDDHLVDEIPCERCREQLWNCVNSADSASEDKEMKIVRLRILNSANSAAEDSK